jgi:hypothetical protein
MEALKQITIKGSGLRPLIMAIEDLHWVDRSSEDTLKSLLESIAGSRVFLIFTYRPEFVQTWGARSFHRSGNAQPALQPRGPGNGDPSLGHGEHREDSGGLDPGEDGRDPVLR